MLVALPALALTSLQTRTIEIVRGLDVAGQPQCQDVEDTTLDSFAPDTSAGGFYTLQGGPGRTILVRFGDLRRVVGRAKVVSATLILTPSGNEKPALKSAARVLVPWGEGPAYRLTDLTRHRAADAKPDATPWGTATWRSRANDVPNSKWQLDGAQGIADAEPIPDAKLTSTDNGAEITGITRAVQEMVNHPYSNYGFALNFESGVEFFSSESKTGKPVLKLQVEDAPAEAGPDLAVTEIDKVTDGGRTIYRAHVKNIGSAQSTGFLGVWSIDGTAGVPAQVGSLDAGAEKTVDYDGNPKLSDKDHRAGTIGFTASPSGNDSEGADKGLTIFPNGLGVRFVVSPETFDKFKTVESPRGLGFENWAQAQIDAINNLYLARSLYSYAPDGCLERVRLTRIVTAPASASIPADTESLVTQEVGAASIAAGPIDQKIVASVLQGLGAPNLGVNDYPWPTDRIKVQGFAASGLSWFPDVTGGGDTRFDGDLPPTISLPQAAFPNLLTENATAEPCGLLSGTGVSALNAGVGKSVADRAAAIKASLDQFPGTTLVRAMDALGRPIKGLELAFFQSKDGSIGGDPVSTLTTTAGGLAILSSKPVAGGSKDVKPNPFGTSNFEGDGVFLVRATLNGETGWSWIKWWQLHEAALRGTKTSAFLDLYFPIPQEPVDRTTDYALGRVISDSANDLPAKLSPIVTEGNAALVQLPSKEGDYVEIDLNRDRTLDEIRLVAGNDLWPRFDIMIYGTGQRPEEALPWAREIDWAWTKANRGQTKDGQVTVPYRGQLITARYIRIVCRKSGPASLARIQVFSPKADRSNG